MSREIEMKQKVLQMLKEFMLGEEGSKFKPKSIEVEMVGKPKESLVDPEDFEESAEDRMHDKMGAEKHHMSEDEWEDSEQDEAEDEEMQKKGKMSLKDFLASRSE